MSSVVFVKYSTEAGGRVKSVSGWEGNSLWSDIMWVSLFLPRSLTSTGQAILQSEFPAPSLRSCDPVPVRRGEIQSHVASAFSRQHVRARDGPTARVSLVVDASCYVPHVLVTVSRDSDRLPSCGLVESGTAAPAVRFIDCSTPLP